MKISRKYLVLNIGFFLIALFCFTNGLHTTVFGGYMNHFAIFLIGTMIVWNGGTHAFKSKMLYVALALVMVVLINNQDAKAYGTYYIYDIYVSICCWILFILCADKGNWYKTFLKIFGGFSLLHATCTIVFKIVPGLYPSVVTPLFGNNASTMINAFNRGFSPGLTPSYSVNAIYASIGCCLYFSKILTKQHNKIDVIKLLIVLFALFLTGKRMHPISIVCAFIVAYYFYNSERKFGRAFKIIMALVFGYFVLMALSNFIPELSKFINRFYETSEMGDVTLGRSARYLTAWNLFLQNPILGIGWHGTIYHFVSTQDLYIDVHNIYIQLLAETGLVGTILYFSFFIYNFAIALRMIKNVKKKIASIDSVYTRIIVSAFSYEVFFLLYGITGNPLYDYMTLIPYVLSCGAVYYLYKHNCGE